MNTDNKIVVSSSPRSLKKQLSNGVKDVHKAEHSPALPNATMAGANQRKLNRWSSSFKEVVDKQPEVQALPMVPEASVASSSSSPRIGARYEQAELENTQAQSREQDTQYVEAVVQQASRVADADGFIYARQRSSRSPQRTRDELPAVSSTPSAPSHTSSLTDSQGTFGIPAHTNPFAVLAEGHVKSGASTPWCETPKALSEHEEVTPFEEEMPFAHYPELMDGEEDVIFYKEEPRSRGTNVAGSVNNLVHGVGGFIKAHPKTTVVVSVIAISACRLLFSRRRRF